MDPVDLERALDRELKQLPRPRAPETLLTRVMAAAYPSIAPWYRRPWLTWPAAWQVASAALLAGFVAALWIVSGAVHYDAASIVARAGGVALSAATDAVRNARYAVALVQVVSDLFLRPVAVYVFALAISLSVVCGALWTAVNRFAPGGASRP